MPFAAENPGGYRSHTIDDEDKLRADISRLPDTGHGLFAGVDFPERAMICCTDPFIMMHEEALVEQAVSDPNTYTFNVFPTDNVIVRNGDHFTSYSVVTVDGRTGIYDVEFIPFDYELLKRKKHVVKYVADTITNRVMVMNDGAYQKRIDGKYQRAHLKSAYDSRVRATCNISEVVEAVWYVDTAPFCPPKRR